MIERVTSGSLARIVRIAGIVTLLVGGRATAESLATPKLTVCMVALNGADEINAFRSSLDPREFDFIEIRAPQTSLYSPHQGTLADGGASWLIDACRPELTCDIVVYSAEFAGQFFGTSGVSLSLQEMEEASCKARCAGLFRHPAEVFLLGCNTLATKDEDQRTPAQYLEVLIEHGFDRAAAERVVELRYGSLGPSFRESVRRIFAGVPRIYGFASVAPRAEYTAPMLGRYLRGNYADTLRQSGREQTQNRTLLATFQKTSLVQVAGLMPIEPEAVDRAQTCALYDDARPLPERLRIAYGLLSRPDALRFIPIIEVFLSRHPAEDFTPVERSILGEMLYLYAARDSVLAIVHNLNPGAFKLELAHFASIVGWLSEDDFHAMAVATVTPMLGQQLSPEDVDIVCAIATHQSLRDDIDADAISGSVHLDAHALRLLACLAPADPRVAPRVVAALRSTDAVEREWAAYALTQLRPANETVLASLVPYLSDPSPAVAERIRWLFRTQEHLPASVAEAIRAVDPDLLRERVGAHRGPLSAPSAS